MNDFDGMIQLTLAQCTKEGWTDKIKEQNTEGCRISGTVKVNKVITACREQISEVPFSDCLTLGYWEPAFFARPVVPEQHHSRTREPLS